MMYEHKNVSDWSGPELSESYHATQSKLSFISTILHAISHKFIKYQTILSTIKKFMSKFLVKENLLTWKTVNGLEIMIDNKYWR